MQHFYTDYWHGYQNFLPKTCYTMTKVETYKAEGMNTQLRHYLAGFHKFKQVLQQVWVHGNPLHLSFNG